MIIKRWTLHPFLFAFFPVSTLFLNNLTILSPASLIRPALVLQAIVLLVWGGFSRLFGNARAGAVAVSIVMFVFSFNPHSAGLAVLGGWVLLCAGLACAGRFRPHRLASLSPALDVVAIVLLAFQIAQYVQAVRPANLKPVVVGAPAGLNTRTAPHVIHIVLDGFGRTDTLQRQFGCDLRFLTEYLEKQGFLVATNATANYLKTMHSMGAALSMEYLPGTSATGLTRQTMLSRPQLDRLVEDAPVRKRFSAAGYRCEGSVISESTLRDWHRLPGRPFVLTLAEKTLLLHTLAAPLLGTNALLRQGYGPLQDALLNAHADRVRKAFDDDLASLSGPDPVYKILHVLSPHPPFLFLADGRRQPFWQTDDFIFSDGDHFLRNDDAWSNYREGYGEQVQFVAREACRLVDRILAASSRPVVVIIQGDHGPGLNFSFESSAGSLDHRSSIFMAIRIPGGTPPLSPEFQSPVNLYRYLFDEIWQAKLPLLPTRIFYSGWTSPEVYEDVTDRVRDERRSWTFQETAEHRALESFLYATRATWERATSAGWVFFDRVRPCEWDTVVTAHSSVEMPGAPEAATALGDGDLGTRWTATLAAGQISRCRIRFNKPADLGGLRFISLDEAWPSLRSISVATADNTAVVLTNWSPSVFTWSGSELYEREYRPQQEVFFRATAVSQIDLEFAGADDVSFVALNEVECLAPAPRPSSWPEDEVFKAMQDRGATRVYAPRWLERALHDRSGGRLAVAQPAPYLHRGACSVWRDVSSSLVPVKLTRDTVIVGYRSDLTASEAAFRQAGVSPHSMVLGPLVLYGLDEANWKDAFACDTRLYNVDGRIRFNGDKTQTQALARFFHDQARQPGLSTEQRIEALSQCVAVYPDYQPAWQQLADLQQQAGNSQDAERSRREWQTRTVPDTRCEASFEPGASLLGYTLTPRQLAPGARGTLVCYWQVAPGLSATRWAAFLHFRRNGKRLFQGDRAFLEDCPPQVIRDQPFAEVIRQDMPFEVPAGLSEGPCEIYLGLYDRDSLKRAKVRSPHAARDRCIKLPTQLTVRASASGTADAVSGRATVRRRAPRRTGKRPRDRTPA